MQTAPLLAHFKGMLRPLRRVCQLTCITNQNKHRNFLEAEADSTDLDVDMAIQMIPSDDAKVIKDAQQMLSKLE